MKIGILKIKLRAAWVNSLKEKRMILKSLISKLKNKFNISVAEIGEQDNHKILNIGIACVSNSNLHLDSTLDNIIDYIEYNTEAEVLDIARELI